MFEAFAKAGITPPDIKHTPAKADARLIGLIDKDGLEALLDYYRFNITLLTLHDDTFTARCYNSELTKIEEAFPMHEP